MTDRSRRPSSWAKHLRRPLLILGIVALAAGASLTAAAYAVDRLHADRIPPGITIAGVKVGGLGPSQAMVAVAAKVEPPLQDRLTIRAGTRTLKVSPAGLGVRAQVAQAVQQAVEESQSMSWPTRSYHRLLGRPVGRAIAVTYTYPTTRIRPLVARLAAALDLRPRNAAIAASANDMGITFTHARRGRLLHRTKAVALVLSALRTHADSVRLPVLPLQPQVTDARLGKTITVDLSSNTLRFYDGFRLLRTYPVATAIAPYSTPIGTWHVVEKELHPVWINPGSAWAASMPAMIPPGPANPLGLRALRLDAPSILIHGTPEDSSVGHWASHGCVRMHEADAIALYPLVPTGTRVIVFGAPPWGASSVAGAPPGF